MHSSRMHTTRAFTVCQSLLLGGDVPGPRGCAGPRGVPGPRGCTWSRGVYLVLGVEGVHGLRKCTWSGGDLVPGVPGQVLPSVDRMTPVYENITLPQTSFAGGNNAFAHECPLQFFSWIAGFSEIEKFGQCIPHAS